MNTEKAIETSILDYLRYIGVWSTKVQSGKLFISGQGNGGRDRFIHMAPSGTPDILACIKGNFVAIEVKKDDTEVRKWFAYPLGLKGKPLKYNKKIEDQQYQRRKIRDAGGIHLVCSSVEELEEDLKSLELL